jgi:hypothetical protein
MKKRLFEHVGGNTFKLMKESDWRTVQDNNGRVNRQRRMLKHEAEYMKAVLTSPQADEQAKQYATEAVKIIKEMDAVVSKGYLDSGYQYDDNDPRNKMDQMDDKYFDREKARTGSSKEDEVEAEIRQAIAQRHLDERQQAIQSYFSNEKSEEIFPKGHEMHGMGLGEYLSEMGYHESQADWDAEHDDRN